MGDTLSQKWWTWLIPLTVVLAIFYLYPIVQVMLLGFTNMQVTSNHYKITLGSYAAIVNNGNLVSTLKVTLIFVLCSVVLQLLLGLACALLIAKEPYGAGLVKFSMIAAWVVPGIIAGIIWKILYSYENWGIINSAIASFGLHRLSFLARPGLALFSAILANTWRGCGFTGIMEYAGLRAIPTELYEAAEIDGAGAFQRFRRITLPLLRPMLLINVVLITIYSFNTYGPIWALTRGGPGDATTVIALRAYEAVFQFLSIGRGSAYAMIMVVLSVIFTVIYLRVLGDRGGRHSA